MIRKIEILFPCPVELPDGFEQELDALVDKVCKKFKVDNPEYAMWPSGHGSKVLWREPEEPDFDDEVYEITVAVENVDFDKNSLVKSLAFPYLDCYYFEEDDRSFDSCPVTKHGKSEITIYCGKCNYNPYQTS